MSNDNITLGNITREKSVIAQLASKNIIEVFDFRSLVESAIANRLKQAGQSVKLNLRISVPG